MVRLDRAAPQAPLKAQQQALERLRRGHAVGEAALLLSKMGLPSQSIMRTPKGNNNMQKNHLETAIMATLPSRFANLNVTITAANDDGTDMINTSKTMKEDEDGTSGGMTVIESCILNAIKRATKNSKFKPNQSQINAVKSGLQRRIALLQGPPGTGQTLHWNFRKKLLTGIQNLTMVILVMMMTTCKSDKIQSNRRGYLQ